jgi:DNA replication protein DnaC
MNETIDQKLATLKLGRIRQIYASWAEQAAQGELGYEKFLDQLLSEELLARTENQLRRKMKLAGFPYAATIEQFDFSLRPELKRPVLMRFFDSSFITTASSLLLIGPSGLGKTHLAVAVGTKMVQLGYSVRFVVAQRLANAVVSAATRTELTHLIDTLTACDLLILDEFGYLTLDPKVGPVLYELIAAR